MSHRVEHPKRQRPYVQTILRSKEWERALRILRSHESGAVELAGMYGFEQKEVTDFIQYINSLYLGRKPFSAIYGPPKASKNTPSVHEAVTRGE